MKRFLSFRRKWDAFIARHQDNSRGFPDHPRTGVPQPSGMWYDHKQFLQNANKYLEVPSAPMKELFPDVGVGGLLHRIADKHADGSFHLRENALMEWEFLAPHIRAALSDSDVEALRHRIRAAPPQTDDSHQQRQIIRDHQPLALDFQLPDQEHERQPDIPARRRPRRADRIVYIESSEDDDESPVGGGGGSARAGPAPAGDAFGGGGGGGARARQPMMDELATPARQRRRMNSASPFPVDKTLSPISPMPFVFSARARGLTPPSLNDVPSREQHDRDIRQQRDQQQQIPRERNQQIPPANSQRQDVHVPCLRTATTPMSCGTCMHDVGVGERYIVFPCGTIMCMHEDGCLCREDGAMFKIDGPGDDRLFASRGLLCGVCHARGTRVERAARQCRVPWPMVFQAQCVCGAPRAATEAVERAQRHAIEKEALLEAPPRQSAQQRRGQTADQVLDEMVRPMLVEAIAMTCPSCKSHHLGPNPEIGACSTLQCGCGLYICELCGEGAPATTADAEVWMHEHVLACRYGMSVRPTIDDNEGYFFEEHEIKCARSRRRMDLADDFCASFVSPNMTAGDAACAAAAKRVAPSVLATDLVQARGNRHQAWIGINAFMRLVVEGVVAVDSPQAAWYPLGPPGQ